MDVVDKLTALDVKAATTAGEIATGLSEFANLADLSGISIDQAAAMVATIADVSQVSGSQAGNSIKMMLSRYGTVKSGKFDAMSGDTDTEALNDVEKVLNKIGISMRGANNQFREFDDVLEDLSDKWQSLDNISKAAVATAVAGTRQREAFLVLMENMDKYHKLTEVSANSAGTAEKKYLSYTEQLQASQNRLTAAWEKLAQNANINEFLTNVTNFTTFLVEQLPFILKWVTRIGVILNAYKIPRFLSNMSSFMGLTGFVNGVRGLGSGLFTGVGDETGFKAKAKKFGENLGENIEKGNENILNSEASRYNSKFGLGKTNSILEKILERMPGGSGSKTTDVMTDWSTFTEEEFKKEENMKKWLAEADNEAVLREKLKTTYSKEGLSYEELAVDADAQQLAYEIAQSKVKSTSTGSGGGGTTVVAGKTSGKGLAAMAIASGAASIATGIMTTGSTHVNSATGETVESSEGASGAMKGTSAAINALGMIGWIWGPIGGMIGQTIASVLDGIFTPLIGKWIDADRDARNQRVKVAEEALNTLNSISASVGKIAKFTLTKGVDYDDYQDMISALNELKELLANNTDILWMMESALHDEVINGIKITDIRSLQKVINSFAEASLEDRQLIYQMLQVAVTKTTSKEQLAAKENEFRDVSARFAKNRESGLVAGSTWSQGAAMQAHLEQNGITYINPTVQDAAHYKYETDKNTSWSDFQAFVEWAEANGIDIKVYNNDPDDDSTKPYAGIWTASFDAKTNKELLEDLQKYADWLYEQGNTSMYNQVIEQIKEYKSALTELQAAYDEINSTIVQTALLMTQITVGMGEGAKQVSLLTANLGQLKEIGKEGIWEAVAQELEKQGGLYGYSIYSEEGKALIEQAIKSNATLYSIWTGQAYTLSEAIKSSNQEILRSFASALGVSIERLYELESKLGDLRLADILATPSDTREKITTLTNLFTSMASSTGLTAENLESIINNFPELIKYLKDSVSLGSALLKQLDAYNELYGRQILSELLDNASYFDQFKDELKDKSSTAYYELINSVFGGSSSMRQMLELIASTREDAMSKYNISGETYDLLQSLYSEYFDFTTQSTLGTEAFESYVSYWNKVWDKQISNLETQKAALQEINKQREYENKLIEAKLKLEEASKEKKKVWREGVGWAYEANQEEIAKAEENLEEVTREQQISMLEQQIEQLNYFKEKLDQITDDEELKNLRESWESWILDNDLVDENTLYNLLNATNGDITSLLASGGYSVAWLLSQSYQELIQIKINGQKALKEQAEAKEKAKADVFGNTLGDNPVELSAQYWQEQYEIWKLKAEQLKLKLLGQTNSDKYKENQARLDELEAQHSQTAAALSQASEQYNQYEMGQGSLWDDVMYAKYMMGQYDKDTDEYKKWEQKYNEAVSKYAQGVQNYGSQYDNAGDYWDSMTDEQKAIAQNPESYKVDESYVSYKLNMNGDTEKYRTIGAPIMPGDSAYDALQNVASSSGDKNKPDLWYWRPNAEIGNDNIVYKDKHKTLGKSSFNKDYQGNLGVFAASVPVGTVVADSGLSRYGVVVGDANNGRGFYELVKAATGSLGLPGGPTMVNENGTEAIITPSGTIAALPSNTGVVPADVTRNLWQLGELAPSILRALGVPIASGSVNNSSVNNTDSINIGSVIMQVSADEGFDPQKFVEMLKAQAALNKNNRR